MTSGATGVKSRWGIRAPKPIGQQSLEVQVHVAPADLGLQSVLIGHDELAQTMHHLRKDVGGNETIVPYFLSPLCPHKVRLFASSHYPVDMGCCLEAIVRTSGYVM
jgi:hypothetical protein